ncbi:hypothetical protein ANCCEY_04045 [Ancylostoma ceylanicum]|uniref:TLC domain-containing protein n=1 Tax=Ancylostoma ceylanicum TaxID=53326 RepID=A0A0D6M055_9BILA|nr:hypothetical protein ANCCEY_04045 [Ancylostoma ceylanicum]
MSVARVVKLHKKRNPRRGLFRTSQRLVAGSFLFFRVLQYVVRWYLFGKCSFRAFSYFGISGRNRNRDSSRDLTVVPPNKKWRISNEAVSLIHSVVSGLWAAYALLFYQRLFDDLISYRCQVALDLIYVSFGYLLHDFFDLVVNEQSARIIELLFHHLVVIMGFIVTLVTKKYLGVVIFGLLMELNSVIQIPVIPWLHSVFTIFVIFSLFCSNTILAYRVMAADGLFGQSRARKSPAQTTSTAADVEAGEREEADEEDEQFDEDYFGLEDFPFSGGHHSWRRIYNMKLPSKQRMLVFLSTMSLKRFLKPLCVFVVVPQRLKKSSYSSLFGSWSLRCARRPAETMLTFIKE